VKRIGTNIREEKDVTELLLNFKKDGTPFWNLLYICPLRDQQGKTIFFLGGQVDVTKNVNNSSPIKELIGIVESTSKKPEIKKKRSFFKFFRRESRASSSSSLVTPGAEAQTVDPEMDLDTQKEVFLETYTNFIIFNAKKDLGKIEFVSSKFSEITGFKEEDVIGRDASFLRGPYTSKVALKELKQASKSGKAWSKEIVAYDSNSNPHGCHLFLTPLQDQNNEPSHYIAVMKWRNLSDTEIEEAKWKSGTEKDEEATDCLIQ